MPIGDSSRRHPRKKRLSMLWSYPLTAAAAAIGVLLFALLYNGSGASVLLAAMPSPIAEVSATPAPAATPTPAITGRLLPCLEGNVWGYKNTSGQTAIAPQFLRALEFGKDACAFAAVEQDGALRYGLLSRSGIWAAEPVWSDVRGFSEGLAAVEQDGKWGYIDTAGKTVIPCVYREAGDFHNGRASVRPASSFGYIDPDGDFAIAAQFDLAGDFGDDMAFVKQNSKQYIINKVGEKIATLGKESGTVYSGGFAAINNGDGTWSYFNTARRRAFTQTYEGAGNFSEDYAAVKRDGLWGYINTGGVMVIGAQYAAAGEFSQSRAPVQDTAGKWGFIDKAGEHIIPCLYDEAGAFYMDTAVVKTGNIVGVVNRSGEFTQLYTVG